MSDLAGQSDFIAESSFQSIVGPESPSHGLDCNDFVAHFGVFRSIDCPHAAPADMRAKNISAICPAPIKRDPQMDFYRIAEERLLACIARKFGLALEMPQSVKRAATRNIRIPHDGFLRPPF